MEKIDKYFTLIVCFVMSLSFSLVKQTSEFIEQWNCDYIIPWSYFTKLIVLFSLFYITIQFVRLIWTMHVLIEYVIFKVNSL